MKKIVAVLAVMVLVVSLVSLAFAADAMVKGTIKSVDAKAGKVTFCPEGGKDEALKADKSVDLSKVKAGDKVEASVHKGMLMSMKAVAAPAAAAPAAAAPAAAPAKKAPVGC
jgi:hypothetical protein